jgi:hypothetical protein
MRHAGPAALDRLAPLLDMIRGQAGLTERSRGIFYRRGRAFLHLHEDPAGLFADLSDGAGDFGRHRVETDAECEAFAAWLAAWMERPVAGPQPRAVRR